MPKTNTRDNNRISQQSARQASFSTHFHRSRRHQRRYGPPPELAAAPLNPLIGLRRFLDDTPLPDGRLIPAKIGAYLARLAELAHGYGSCTLSVEHLAAKAHRCERSIKRYTKYLRERYLITVSPRLRENGSCTTNEISINWDNPFFDEHLRNRCAAESSVTDTVTKESPPDESSVVDIGVYQSSSVVDEQKPRTDTEPEPIRETKQDPPNKPQLVDNVYSVDTAESPVKTPILSRVQDLRQTLDNWFRVPVSFQTTLWLLSLMLVRRWNIRAFLLDVDQHHKPRLFRSQDACWRYIAADYIRRGGPVLESYPPEKRIVQPLAPIERSAVSDQQSAESPPVSVPRRMSASGSSAPASAPDPPCSAERLAELYAEGGITNDAPFLRWLLEQPRHPPQWPPGEASVRRWIARYLATIDRNRSSASSDAESSNRASSDASVGGAGGSPGEPAD